MESQYPELNRLPPASLVQARKIFENFPVRRSLELRDPARSMRLGETTNLVATLGYMRGEERSTPCHHCSKRCGPFVKCVVLNGYWDDVCTNCKYGNMAGRCSFRDPSDGLLGKKSRQSKQVLKRLEKKEGIKKIKPFEERREQMRNWMRDDSEINEKIYLRTYAESLRQQALDIHVYLDAKGWLDEAGQAWVTKMTWDQPPGWSLEKDEGGRGREQQKARKEIEEEDVIEALSHSLHKRTEPMSLNSREGPAENEENGSEDDDEDENELDFHYPEGNWRVNNAGELEPEVEFNGDVLSPIQGHHNRKRKRTSRKDGEAAYAEEARSKKKKEIQELRIATKRLTYDFPVTPERRTDESPSHHRPNPPLPPLHTFQRRGGGTPPPSATIEDGDKPSMVRDNPINGNTSHLISTATSAEPPVN
ncbi:uncharacterized protein PAC_10373 [Phialocephala subalpina]|uniref:Uncharacterized protein n=1 Tax=Phialocephala subalpina TaxID=576137 RepID=A0A1L7X624_9HELO|nr:uncharacterized protein PAC_10373 [Phialocephala subalpina]